jgi:hypothetical protein
MPFNFDYATFYNYYTDKKNLLINNNPIDIYFFPQNPLLTLELPDKKVTSNYYITIGGIHVYISLIGKNNNIIFTIPNDINGVFYDDHYHFGLQLKDEKTILLVPSYKKIPTVFFHKTVQLPYPLSKGGKDSTLCWFRDGISITNIKDIVCTQEKSTTMNVKFPFPSTFTLDMDFIQEIISRPFLGIRNQGGAYKYTVKNLKELAKKRKIVGYSKLNKKDLIKLLKIKIK